MRYYLMPVRMAITKRQEITNAGMDMQKRKPLCTIVGLLTYTSTMENSMEVPQKIKNRTTIWSSNSTSGNISKGNKNTNSKRYLCPHVHRSIIYNNQDIETNYGFINGWVDKEVVILILLSHKKQGSSTICNNIDESWRHYAKWNESDRERPHTVWFHLHETPRIGKSIETESGRVVARG